MNRQDLRQPYPRFSNATTRTLRPTPRVAPAPFHYRPWILSGILAALVIASL
jgi:hypothetical protein